MKKIALATLILFLGDTAYACKPAPPTSVKYRNSQRSTILTSPNKNFFLKLVPSKWATEKGRTVKKRDSYALAFEAMPDGQIKPLWSYKHWDANGGAKLYLSNDGMNLVEMINYVKSRLDTTAVITYKKGKKVRAYSPSYFGVNTPLRKTSCGSGSWTDYRAKVPEFSVYDGITLQTINGLRWTISPENLAIRRVK